MTTTKKTLDPLAALDRRIANADFPTEGLLVSYRGTLESYVVRVNALRRVAALVRTFCPETHQSLIDDALDALQS